MCIFLLINKSPPLKLGIKLFYGKIKHFTPIFFDMKVFYFIFAILISHKQISWQKSS